MEPERIRPTSWKQLLVWSLALVLIAWGVCALTNGGQISITVGQLPTP